MTLDKVLKISPKDIIKSNLYSISIRQWSGGDIPVQQLSYKVNYWQWLNESSRGHVCTTINKHLVGKLIQQKSGKEK